jgi:hypothetical protein
MAVTDHDAHRAAFAAAIERRRPLPINPTPEITLRRVGLGEADSFVSTRAAPGALRCADVGTSSVDCPPNDKSDGTDSHDRLER